MSKSEKVLRKCIWTHVSPEEYAQLQKRLAESSDPSMASYARKLLLGRPVTIFYRDRAFDDFTEARIQFRKDVELILEKGGLSETEKDWLHRQMTIMHELHVKIDLYVRNSKQTD
ncbi:MAG: hypothetical protein J0H74_28795 [Chitinophagaceae bacterium]|nr:hypothetical protein [Chitinophagaceae bacterium]